MCKCIIYVHLQFYVRITTIYLQKFSSSQVQLRTRHTTVPRDPLHPAPGSHCFTSVNLPVLWTSFSTHLPYLTSLGGSILKIHLCYSLCQNFLLFFQVWVSATVRTWHRLSHRFSLLLLFEGQTEGSPIRWFVSQRPGPWAGDSICVPCG